LFLSKKGKETGWNEGNGAIPRHAARFRKVPLPLERNGARRVASALAEEVLVLVVIESDDIRYVDEGDDG
jgi:hypothetical protein